MNYLIDTCVLSEYKKLNPEAKVINWLDGQVDDSLYISALTIGELEKGIVRMPMSKRKTDLEAFLETLIIRFDRRLLTIDTPIMRRWGRLVANLENKGRVIPLIDSLMAATALEYDLTIATRNESDFVATGVSIVNPWNGTGLG